MAMAKRKTTTRKVATRAKPKSAKNASAKRVKRATTTRRSSTVNTASKTATAKAAPNKSAASATAVDFKAQSDAMMKMGADALRQMMSALPAGSQDKFQSQVNNMSQESVAQMAKSADAASKSMGEMLSMSKDNIDTAVTCSSIAVNASKTMGAELFNYANKSFSQNVEMSKEIFGCRTLNDMFDLQSKVVKANLDHFFNESVKMSEMMFKCSNEISEPLNKKMSENANRLTKAMADAA